MKLSAVAYILLKSADKQLQGEKEEDKHNYNINFSQKFMKSKLNKNLLRLAAFVEKKSASALNRLYFGSPKKSGYKKQLC